MERGLFTGHCAPDHHPPLLRQLQQQQGSVGRKKGFRGGAERMASPPPPQIFLDTGLAELDYDILKGRMNCIARQLPLFGKFNLDFKLGKHIFAGFI